MKLRSSLLAHAIAFGLATPLAAQELSPREAQLLQRVDTLEKRLAEIESKQAVHWLDQRRGDEVKALIREVLADADTRASLMADGAVAGWNKGKFFIGSADGAFLLNIGGRIQFRHVANFRESPTAIDANHDGDTADPGEGIQDQSESGFQVRRVKQFFNGHVGNPRIEYTVTLAADRNLNVVGLEEARFGYVLAEGLKIEAGRFKSAFLREENISASKQLAAERSYVNEAFTIGFIEGVSMSYAGDAIRAVVSFNDGRNQGEVTNAANDFQNDTTDAALTGRIDIRLAGDWKQMEDFSAWSGEGLGIFVGGGIHYEVAETGQATGAGSNDSQIYWTVDGSLESNGFNFYAAFMGRHFNDEDGVAGENNFDQYGFLVQAGYMVVPDFIEPFARFEWLDMDNRNPFNVGSGAFLLAYDDDIYLITVGVNVYFRKHDAKMTIDLVFVPDDAVPFAQTGLGLLQDDATDTGQFLLRSQFQLNY